ncbi:MAG: DUF6119 family protein [Anaerolineae bacterium]
MAPNSPLPYAAQLYLQPAQSAEPAWLSYFQGHFTLAGLGLRNVSNSMVLLVSAGGRVFAVTGGRGAAALKRERLEPNFGLRVVLNEIERSSIRELSSRSVDTRARQTYVFMSKNGILRDFDVDVDSELVQSMSGLAADTELGTRLRGADSLTLTAECPLDDLGDKCLRLLEAFNKTDYQQSFDFIDHVRLIRDQRLAMELDALLVDYLSTLDDTELVVAYPSLDVAETAVRFRIGRHGSTVETDDLLASDVLALYATHPELDRDPRKSHVHAFNSDGFPVGPTRTLYDYLVFETEYQGAKYVLSRARWYAVDEGYAARLDSDIRSVPDLTGSQQLMLPTWAIGENEGAYNARAAGTCQFALLDKALYHVSGRDKIEACDLLAPTGLFICVKKYSGSADLSHLFSQASVSATLLQEDQSYRDFVQTQCQGTWSLPYVQDGVLDRSRITFVLAIGTDKDRPLAETLPLFSKVNVRRTIRDLKRMYFGVALYHIHME